ncbi:MAG: DUF5008 domain-containing protein [Sphingobacteriaceae bacterium]|nr:DUF5008 domain-containing protein [Sphingobacteriaceae bacterium]
MMMKLNYIITLLLVMAITFIGACKREEVYENPYSGGKAPLGVEMSKVVTPSPVQASGGTLVTFAVKGLLPYKDKLVFMFNGTPAEVTNITDQQVVVKVPDLASSGMTSIAIDNQVFFGPRFKVTGKISVDAAWKVASGGANKDISDILPLNDGRMIFVGSFTDYDSKGIVRPLNRIVQALKDGGSDPSFKSEGADNTINSIAADGSSLLVAGSFTGFLDKGVTYRNYFITRLNADGTPKLKTVPYFTGTRIVSTFSGGTNGTILNILMQSSKIIAVGGFTKHLKFIYGVLGTFVEETDAPQVIRMDTDGNLDKTYRFDVNLNAGLSGGNGSILGSVITTDGKVVLTGRFNKFDNVQANYIVQLNTDGTVDPTFQSGSGANKPINNISYNPATGKFLITGTFTTYNGQPAKGIAMLNSDGSLDNEFTSKGFTSEGVPSFAKQLSNGLILVSGSFTTYNGIRRVGLMVLDDKGSLAPGYNNIGDFRGVIKEIYESMNSSGKMTVVLAGSFTQIDGLPVSHVTRLVLEPLN